MLSVGDATIDNCCVTSMLSVGDATIDNCRVTSKRVAIIWFFIYDQIFIYKVGNDL